MIRPVFSAVKAWGAHVRAAAPRRLRANDPFVWLPAYSDVCFFACFAAVCLAAFFALLFDWITPPRGYVGIPLLYICAAGAVFCIFGAVHSWIRPLPWGATKEQILMHRREVAAIRTALVQPVSLDEAHTRLATHCGLSYEHVITPHLGQLHWWDLEDKGDSYWYLIKCSRVNDWYRVHMRRGAVLWYYENDEGGGLALVWRGKVLEHLSWAFIDQDTMPHLSTAPETPPSPAA